MSTRPSVRPFLRFLTGRRTLFISAPFSRGVMSVVLTSSNHRVWSRFNFQLSFGHPPDEWWDADRAFNSFPLIPGHENTQDHIDPNAVKADFDRLDSETSMIREHVEPTVAHRSPMRESQEPITYGAFHTALQAIDEVFRKYYVLLTHKSVARTEPVAQYDEFEAFTFPWIEDQNKFDYKKAK